MFGRSTKRAIDSLVGVATRIDGNLYFSGGLRIDGEIHGDVIAQPGESGMLVISEHARIEGRVSCANIIVNGYIAGPVCASEHLELQPQARIVGDVAYRLMEMHVGAVVSGKLIHQQGSEPGEARLSLATA
jgi:cytoskeletal protein CcmA (bactofilin family)